jgi:hypothetical protein
MSLCDSQHPNEEVSFVRKSKSATAFAPLALLLSILTGGCVPQPPASEDAVLYYFRGASVHGQVRRTWPAGQKYVDSVLKADSALKSELAPFMDLLAVGSFWHADDHQWQDEAVRQARLDELTLLVKGEYAKYQQLLDARDRAIETTPDGLDLTDPLAKSRFIDTVRDVLGPDAQDLAELRENAEKRLKFGQMVESHAERFDAQKPGLSFTDAAAQQSVRQAHAEIRADLLAHRDARLEWLRRALLETVTRLKEINRRDNAFEYQYLIDRRKALQTELVDMPKAARAEIEALQKLADGKAPTKAARIEELEAQRKTLKERVDAVLADANAAAADSPTPPQ